MAGIDTYTKLMLHMNGIEGGTTFTDSSDSAHTVVRTGLTTTTANKKFGTAATEKPDTTGKYLTIANSSDFAFGSGDFCIDLWMRTNYFGATAHIMSYASSDSTFAWKFYINGSSQIQFDWYSSTNQLKQFTTSATGLTDNNWHHYAMIRSGNNGFFAVDGTLGTPVDLTGLSQRDSGSYIMTIGSNYTHTHANYYGFDELRVSKGAARWSTNFTPPTAEYSAADISGTLSHEARIVIVDQSTWEVEHSEIHSAGSYVIAAGPGGGLKTVTAIPTSATLGPLSYKDVEPAA